MGYSNWSGALSLSKTPFLALRHSDCNFTMNKKWCVLVFMPEQFHRPCHFEHGKGDGTHCGEHKQHD